MAEYQTHLTHALFEHAEIEDAQNFDEVLNYLTARETFAVLNAPMLLRRLCEMSPGPAQGQLAELFTAAGMPDPASTLLTVRVDHASFEQWWEPFTFGVGPVGVYLAKVDVERRAQVRERCLVALSDGPFVVRGRAWAARGLA